MTAALRRTRFIILVLLLFGASLITAAVVQPHTHQSNAHKEREEDGAYSPRNKDHYSDDGSHHSEFDHEAILGSVKVADEFDRLSPEESKKRLRILLTKMDLNGDSNIDRNELKAWILRSFRMLSVEEAGERLEDVDENGDGMVSWEEYHADTYNFEDSLEENEIDSRTLALITDDKFMWKASDTNGDNILDSTEWHSFTHPEEHPDMFPEIIERSLREKDTNKDGALNFQEYIGERGEFYGGDWLKVEKTKFDQELDKNNDGLLKGDEILNTLLPNNDEIAEEETEHLFAHSDDDHNNYLSFDEILTHSDVFVGSEATDYGDHLHYLNRFEDEL